MCRELGDVHPIGGIAYGAFVSATQLGGDMLLLDSLFSLKEDVLVLVLYCGGCSNAIGLDATAKLVHHLALCLRGLVDLVGQIGGWHQSVHGHVAEGVATITSQWIESWLQPCKGEDSLGSGGDRAGGLVNNGVQGATSAWIFLGGVLGIGSGVCGCRVRIIIEISARNTPAHFSGKE